MPIKNDTSQSLFVVVKNNNTGEIEQIAVPHDIQVGMSNDPFDLSLFGRFSINVGTYTGNSASNTVLAIKSSDTSVNVFKGTAGASSKITLTVPTDPKEGQLHFIKDNSGTAATTNIVVQTIGKVTIDGATSKTINTNYGLLIIGWSSGSWHVFSSTVANSVTGSGLWHSVSGSLVSAASNLLANDVDGPQINSNVVTLVAGVPKWSASSGGTVTSVGATAPITSTGGATPNIGITVSPGAATTVVGTTRAINTTAPITGGGNLSADRTFAISAASGVAAGSMSSADFTKLGTLFVPTGTGLVHTTAGILNAASSQLISGDVAGTTTNGFVVQLVAGVPTWTASSSGAIADQRLFPLITGLQTTGQSSIETLGGCSFNPAVIQATGGGVTRTILFAAQFFTTIGTGEVTLFDVDDNVTIATLTTTSTTITEVESATITIGSVASGVIPNAKRKYEVRARFSAGSPSVTDRVAVEWAAFVITYT